VRFGRFTGAQAGLLDIAVDGAIAAQGLTVGRLTNYLPLSAGVHLIELRSAGVVLASMKLDLEPPSLTTVYGWQQGCGNGAYAIEQVALAPVPAAGKADIDIVNAACSNQTSSYLVDLAAAGSAKANQALRVSVTPAKHHVERLFAPSIDVTAAAGEVWSVFDYVDATGAEVMEAERDAP
jgi:hypothetical protein